MFIAMCLADGMRAFYTENFQWKISYSAFAVENPAALLPLYNLGVENPAAYMCLDMENPAAYMCLDMENPAASWLSCCRL